MDEIKGKRSGRSRAGDRRRLWAVLSTIWLVASCLAGCAGAGNNGAAGTSPASRGPGIYVETGVSGEPGIRGEAGASGPGTEAEPEDGQVRFSETKPETAGDEGRSRKPEPETESNVEGSLREEWEPETEVKKAQPDTAGAEPEAGAAQPDTAGTEPEGSSEKEPALTVEESGFYTSKEEVALYLHLYGRLPENYITKRQAEKLGWDSKAGNLWEVAPGMSIGGSRFGNYEGALPDKEGRIYYECDIDYEGGYRGAKRIIYSNDGLIFYTEDHYKTFEELYGQ